jgi:predicted nucleotidyltransferase
VYLFGSWAGGRALNVSDLDIAFDIGAILDLDTYTDMTLEVDDLLTLRKIDLVDVHTVGTGFRQTILQQGELLYAR